MGKDREPGAGPPLASSVEPGCIAVIPTAMCDIFHGALLARHAP